MDKKKIKIVGIGEGGARAVGKMIASGVGNKNVDFVSIGKDENILLTSATRNNIFLNQDPPTVYKNISAALRDAKLIIIVAGIGGTSATQAIPRIVSLAKNSNATTVAFVSKPFVLESAERKKNAEYCLNSLREVDTTFIFPAEKFFLFRLYQKEVSIAELFEVANEIFYQGVKIFLEISSDKSTPLKLGEASLGYGFGATVLEAIKSAVKFPALEENEIKHSKKIFVRHTGGSDSASKNFIKKMISSDAKLFWQVDNSQGEKTFAAIIFSRKEG
ncbi:MAG: hypothetical protein IKT98_00785 [Selenomonadaceae bacterium]|nr:hypothetical protein [Selenomonadaceae bacterium]